PRPGGERIESQRIQDDVTMKSTLWKAVVSVGVLWSGLSGAFAADKVPAESLLPPGTYAFISVPSVTEFRERCEKSSMGRLMEDEAFADFRKQLEGLMEKVG